MLSSRRSIPFLLVLPLTAVTVSCRSEVDSQSRRTPSDEVQGPDEPPHGEPVEIPDSLGTSRTFYQSRGIISLNVKASALKLGDQFSLVNETTDATLIDQIDDSSAEAALNGWGLDAYDVTLRLYLLDPAFATAFTQGENRLKLFATSGDGDDGRMAYTAITLHDFPIFAFTTGVFDSSEQRSSGFQGGFEPYARSVVTSSGQGFLATGLLSITNQ